MAISDQTKMRTRRRGSIPLVISLQRNSAIPLFRQIYAAIRLGILEGRLARGSRLPSSRLLAQDLRVARSTVVLAYEHLETEGYIHGRGSAGSLVADLPLPSKGRPIERTVRGVRGDAEVRRPVTAPDAGFLPLRSSPVAFRIGEPALDAFPLKLWMRLMARCARREGRRLLGYGDPAGHLPLRRAIAEYVGVSRGVRASAEQVILTRGAQQAMDLVTRILLQPRDKVWVEDPGYLTPRTLAEMAGAHPVPVPVDRDGMDVEAGIRAAPGAVMACVAPSHHFPLGCALSLERKLALLQWAERSGAWIVEDDFDSEFRYTSGSIASLQGLDRSGRVVYIGTFSKTLFPSLRLGYLVAPPTLVEPLRAAAMAVDQVSPSVEHAALAEFIEQGHFTHHVRRMRAAYRERQAGLLAQAAGELDGLLRAEAADTGMHVIGWLMRARDDLEVSRAARRAGIEAQPLSRYCLKARLPPALVLGFAALRPAEIKVGIRGLKDVLASS